MDLSQSLMIRSPSEKLSKFRRDKLFLSIYESCRHLSDPIASATALTDTVIAALNTRLTSGIVEANLIAQTTYDVLNRFDKAAGVQYQAFHL